MKMVKEEGGCHLFFSEPQPDNSHKLSLSLPSHNKTIPTWQPLVKPTPLGLPHSAWPPLVKPRQQAQPLRLPDTAMCAVFLPATKKESGTGVFLPRIPGTPTPPRNKSACGTVLLPARVVQALHLDLDELGAPPRYAGGYVLHRDALVGRSKALHSSKRQVNGHPMQQIQTREEISLPQEWTY